MVLPAVAPPASPEGGWFADFTQDWTQASRAARSFEPALPTLAASALLPGWGWPMAEPEDPTPVYDELITQMPDPRDVEPGGKADADEGRDRGEEVAADHGDERGGAVLADEEDGRAGAEVLDGEPGDPADDGEPGV